MATVHPSRMGLVPQDRKDVYPGLRRAGSPSPLSRYDRHHRDKEKTRKRDSDNDRSQRDDRGRYRRRERSRENQRERSRSRSKTPSRRRASPEYGDYKRPASPGPGTPRMYLNRQPREGAHERRGGYGGGSSEYLERYAWFCFFFFWVGVRTSVLFS